jgi:hypothetical protein
MHACLHCPGCMIEALRPVPARPAVAAEQGWEVDAATGLVLVKAKQAAAQGRASQQQLQRLAEYVVHLEA